MADLPAMGWPHSPLNEPFNGLAEGSSLGGQAQLPPTRLSSPTFLSFRGLHESTGQLDPRIRKALVLVVALILSLSGFVLAGREAQAQQLPQTYQDTRLCTKDPSVARHPGTRFLKSRNIWRPSSGSCTKAYAAVTDGGPHAATTATGGPLAASTSATPSTNAKDTKAYAAVTDGGPYAATTTTGGAVAASTSATPSTNPASAEMPHPETLPAEAPVVEAAPAASWPAAQSVPALTNRSYSDPSSAAPYDRSESTNAFEPPTGLVSGLEPPTDDTGPAVPVPARSGPASSGLEAAPGLAAKPIALEEDKPLPSHTNEPPSALSPTSARPSPSSENGPATPPIDPTSSMTNRKPWASEPAITAPATKGVSSPLSSLESAANNMLQTFRNAASNMVANSFGGLMAGDFAPPANEAAGPSNGTPHKPSAPSEPPAGSDSFFLAGGAQAGSGGGIAPLLLLGVLVSSVIVLRRYGKLSVAFCEVPRLSSALLVPPERPG